MIHDEIPYSSGLFYHGTDVEVRLGDKVLWKRLIRRNLMGIVIGLLAPKRFPRVAALLDLGA
jgi:hypothetical protein